MSTVNFNFNINHDAQHNGNERIAFDTATKQVTVNGQDVDETVLANGDVMVEFTFNDGHGSTIYTETVFAADGSKATYKEAGMISPNSMPLDMDYNEAQFRGEMWGHSTTHVHPYAKEAEVYTPIN